MFFSPLMIRMQVLGNVPRMMRVFSAPESILRMKGGAFGVFEKMTMGNVCV